VQGGDLAETGRYASGLRHGFAGAPFRR